MSKKNVMIGLGGHAGVLLDILSLNKKDCYGYIDLHQSTDERYASLQYLGHDDVFLERSACEDYNLINGIATIKSCVLHRNIFTAYSKAGFNFKSVTHPTAVISKTAVLREGVQVCANAVIQSSALINENVIVNTGAIIEHDSIVGKHSHVAPGAIICGFAEIGEEVIIGAGAVVLPGIKVCSHTVIAAGSVVVRDVTNAGIYIGKPAGLLAPQL